MESAGPVAQLQGAGLPPDLTRLHACTSVLCSHAQQADGQDVVCWYRNPKDVMADMMEDDSMAGQLDGRFEQDLVNDQHGENHRILATVSSSVWMHHWSFKLRGGNRVLVAVRVSGDEFIVTRKRGCHCVYLSAANRQAQTREDGQSFYLLGVMPPYNRELSAWAEHTTHNRAACGRRMREIHSLFMFHMLADLGQPAQHLRVAGSAHSRLWVETKVLMLSTDMKEQWETALTYGYGCVVCVSPRKYDHTGELHVPHAGRDMQHTRAVVLKAQRSGEYGSRQEWREHLQGASRPFMSADQQAARLEVRMT